MKFYEKIIGIDASSHDEIEMIFNNGQVEFDKIYTDSLATASLAITSYSGSEALKLVATGEDTWTWKLGNEVALTWDLYSRHIYCPSQDDMNLGSADHPFIGYFKNLAITPFNGNNALQLAATGIDTWTWKFGNEAVLTWDLEYNYIYCPSQDQMNLGTPDHRFNGYFNTANITTANIANITNATKLGQSSTIITTNREAYIGGIEIYPTLTRTSPNIVTKQTPTSLISGNVPGFTNPTMHMITGRATKAASSLYLYINHNTGRNYDDFHIFTFQRSYTASNYPLYLAPSNDQPSTFTLALKGPAANQNIEYDYLLIYYS